MFFWLAFFMSRRVVAVWTLAQLKSFWHNSGKPDILETQLSGFSRIRNRYRYRDRNQAWKRHAEIDFDSDFDPDPDPDIEPKLS